MQATSAAELYFTEVFVYEFVSSGILIVSTDQSMGVSLPLRNDMLILSKWICVFDYSCQSMAMDESRWDFEPRTQSRYV